MVWGAWRGNKERLALSFSKRKLKFIQLLSHFKGCIFPIVVQRFFMFDEAHDILYLSNFFSLG